MLLEHGEKVVDRCRGGGAEIDRVEIKNQDKGRDGEGRGWGSFTNHTHSVYKCLYSLYRNTPLMCVMWTWRLSDECGYLYKFYLFADSLRSFVFAVGEVTLAVCECQCTHYGTALTDELRHLQMKGLNFQRHIYTLPRSQASQLHDLSVVTHRERKEHKSKGNI